MKKFFSITLMLLVLSAVNFFDTKIFQQENFANARQLSADKNFAEEVLYYVNIEREEVGLKPLRLSPQLMQAADIRAKELLQRFSHTRPDGTGCFTAVSTSYRYIGENIAAGQSSPQEVVEAWMNSQGHRENILNPNFDKMGIGYVYSPNSEYRHYWAQLFMN